MYDSEKEYTGKNKTFQKIIYRFFDSLLLRSDVPVFGKLNNKIRVFLARRISKGISKKAFIQKGAVIVPGVFVEDFGCIGINCYTCWGLHIGEHTMLGPNVVFFSSSHKRSEDGKKFVPGITKHKPIYIGKNCWIGQNSIVLPGVVIGNGVTIGAGSVVTHNVPDYSLAAGNPATIKKKYAEE